MISFKEFILEQQVAKDDSQIIQDLNNFLEGDLRGYGESFVKAGKTYNVDPYLMASIAMLETGRGTSKALRERKNVSGKWDSKAGTHASYNNLNDSIMDQASFLKSGYIDKGLTSIEQIGAKYAPPGASNDPNRTNSQWPANVSKFYSQATGQPQLLASGQFTGSGANTGTMPSKGYERQTGGYTSTAQALAGLASGIGLMKQAFTGGKATTTGSEEDKFLGQAEYQDENEEELNNFLGTA